MYPPYSGVAFRAHVINHEQARTNRAEQQVANSGSRKDNELMLILVRAQQEQRNSEKLIKRNCRQVHSPLIDCSQVHQNIHSDGQSTGRIRMARR